MKRMLSIQCTSKRVVSIAIALCVLCCSIHRTRGFSNPTALRIHGSRLSIISPNLKHVSKQCMYSVGKARTTVQLLSCKDNDIVDVHDDPFFDALNIPKFVGGQSILIVIAIVAALVLNVPNYGLGEGFALDSHAIVTGILGTLPLGLLAVVLDKLEPYVEALQDVTKATQRSVLAILGGKFKPVTALGTSIMLGAVAGIGEEMLFRGVMQGELSLRFGDNVALIFTSIVFGLGHAVTPIYALLASLASIFFGSLYISSHNLAVPIVCHGLYDVGALMWAHYNVTSLGMDEHEALMEF